MQSSLKWGGVSNVFVRFNIFHEKIFSMQNAAHSASEGVSFSCNALLGPTKSRFLLCLRGWLFKVHTNGKMSVWLFESKSHQTNQRCCRTMAVWCPTRRLYILLLKAVIPNHLSNSTPFPSGKRHYQQLDNSWQASQKVKKRGVYPVDAKTNR